MAGGKIRAMAIWACLAAAAWLAPSAAMAIPVVKISSIEGAAGSDWALPAHLGLTVSTPGGIDDIHYINKADCAAIMAAKSPKMKVNWTWQPTIALAVNYTGVVKVAPRGKSCGETTLQKDDTNTSCLVFSEETYKIGATYSAEVDLRDILGSGGSCDDGTEQDAFVYFLVNDQASTGVNQAVVSFKSRFQVDLAGPAAPTIAAVTAGGNNLQVSWTHADDTKVDGSYVYWATLPIEASQVAAGLVKVQKSEKLTTKSYQIKDLTNGTPYYVVVTAVDTHGNESAFSSLGKGTPIEVLDAWQHYKQAGGTEEGGFAPCSAGRVPASTGWLGALLAGLSLMAVRRWRFRKPVAVAALTLALGTLIAGSALAASPLENSLEFRGTRYLPQIDSAFSGATKPYADIFTDADWELGGAADFRLWDRFGSLSLGLGGGLFSKAGNGIVKATGEASSDSTKLKIVPISLDLTYRLEPLAFKLGVPFVPYAKLGPMYAVWWMLNGTGNIAKWKASDGTTKEALGGTGGWHGVIGVRFLLDVLEPGAARSFDIEMGVNHSYLFCEYDKRVLNDFGSSKSIDLSDGVISFGLAFDL